jgi:hypothetical protein
MARGTTETAQPANAGAAPFQKPELPENENRTRLQEVLPEIKDLAQRVGGMQKLADIVNTLLESKL